ncbi:MAG: glycosyltransferase [Phycisphaeraceae bacterium]|nr:glycosyltransferase [Phycisphaeraceae bacterium]
MNAPLLIPLPGGLHTSGVVTWALRLANGLTQQGRRVGIITHRPADNYAPLAARPAPGVRLFCASHLPAFEPLAGDIAPISAFYADAAHAISDGGNTPVIIAPNLLGDCYAAAAALTLTMPRRVRLVGWCHLDSDYDRAVLQRYAPALSACVAVSAHIHSTLREPMSRLRVHSAHIPYGVPIPTSPHRPERAPGPLRLLYAGRLEEGVKRVSALAPLSDTLTSHNIPHHLTIIGDGPAAPRIARDAAARPHWSLLPPCPPHNLPAHYTAADLFVLPSRAEGLSIAMLEAMSHGCVPIVTHVRSGVADALTDNLTGITVPADDTPTHIGEAMARRIATLLHQRGISHLAHMGNLAAAHTRDRFSLDRHLSACAALLDTCAASPPRAWPASMPLAYTAPAHPTSPAGSVPFDAAQRMAAALEPLAGKRVILHGAGAHTLALAAVLARFSDRIIAITDDDPARHNTTLWGWPVFSPDHAPPADAVVVSSCIHQEEIAAAWLARRAPAVIRLYPHRSAA